MMMMTSKWVIIALSLLLLTVTAMRTDLVAAQDAGVKPKVVEDDCPEDITAASLGDDILNEVPCFKTDQDECPTVAKYYSACGMCCPPGEKPEKKGCMSWKEEVSTGSFCGPVGVPTAPLRYDSCSAGSFCDNNKQRESYRTCVKKPSIDEFDCESPPTGDEELTDLIHGTFDCSQYLHKGHPMKCKVGDDGVGKCTERLRPGDSCNDDDDVSPFRCEDEDMICLDGSCTFLKENDKCGDSAEDGFESAKCAPGLECTKRGSDTSSASLYSFDEEVDDADETICIQELLGGDSCGYPGKGCPGSSYCYGAPNGKEDDSRAGLTALGLGAPMEQLLLRCGVFCKGKMAKIDYGLGPSVDGDCVCADDTRCNFLSEFSALGASSATAAEEACPSAEDTKQALADDWKGKTGSCAVPEFINKDHRVGDPCFTASGSRVCANGGQWSGPDTKCDETTTCVNRNLGIHALFKRLGFLEDFDFGNSCSFNEDDATEEEDIEDDIDCVCGPKGKAVWQKSYAPQDDGTAFWCSAIDVIHNQCMHRNQCADPQCGSCRKTYEELIIDCSRPKASSSAYSYHRATSVLGADPNYKNKRFVGAFFGVFFATLFLIAGCCFGCKKCRDKKKAKAEADGDGESKGNAVVPAKGDV